MAAANPKPARWQSTDPQRGSITAEFAVALPAVIMILAFVLVLSNMALGMATLQSAARTGARLVAVETNLNTVSSVVKELAGPGTAVDISVTQGWVTVQVSKPVTVGPFNLGTFRLSSQATTVWEPEVGR